MKPLFVLHLSYNSHPSASVVMRQVDSVFSHLFLVSLVLCAQLLLNKKVAAAVM